MDDLNIIPIKPQKFKGSRKKNEIAESLPSVYGGSLVVIIGPTQRAGKSVLWNNLIHRKSMLGGKFKDIYVVSPTIEQDESSRFTYRKYEDNCTTVYSDKFIENIEKFQKQKLKDETKDASYALILDDIVGCLSKYNTGGTNGASWKNGRAITFCTRYRHYARRNMDACMVLFSLQKYGELSQIIRANMSQIFISGQIKSKKELNAIRMDIADVVGGEAKFNELFAKCNKPYDFLNIKLDTTPVQAYRNLTERLL
jgi:hypothetical protein